MPSRLTFGATSAPSRVWILLTSAALSSVNSVTTMAARVVSSELGGVNPWPKSPFTPQPLGRHSETYSQIQTQLTLRLPTTSPGFGIGVPFGFGIGVAFGFGIGVAFGFVAPHTIAAANSGAMIAKMVQLCLPIFISRFWAKRAAQDRARADHFVARPFVLVVEEPRAGGGEYHEGHTQLRQSKFGRTSARPTARIARDFRDKEIAFFPFRLILRFSDVGQKVKSAGRINACAGDRT